MNSVLLSLRSYAELLLSVTVLFGCIITIAIKPVGRITVTLIV